MFRRKKSSVKGNRELIVGLDLGTTKTSALVAERHNGSLNLIGWGVSPASGMKQGVVVNLEQTVESIIQAVEAAERTANVAINTAYVGVAGDHIRSVNSRGMIAVGKSRNGLGSKISSEDIHRVIETAQTVSFPADRDVLHVIPQDFLVDDREGFRDPTGIVGSRLEANVHIITSALSATQTILSCLEGAGVQPQEFVLQPLASSLACLTRDEKELGCALIDLGGGTADVAVYYDSSIRFTAVVGLGGDNVTRDLAHGLRTPIPQAEKIKIEHGCAHPSKLNGAESILLPGVDDRPDRQIAPDLLCAIIQPRMEEIFDLVLKELRQGDCLSKLSAGVVLTGGGSLLAGAAEVAEEIFRLPVRLAKPSGLNGLKDVADSPIYATGAGLTIYGKQQMDLEVKGLQARKPLRQPVKSNGSKIHHLKEWVAEIF